MKRRTPGESFVRARLSSLVAWVIVGFVALCFVGAVGLSVLDETRSGASVVADVLSAVGLLAFPVVGALIRSRRPENRIGWLLTIVGVGMGLSAFSESYVTYAVEARARPVPAEELMAWVTTWSGILPYGLAITFLLLLFPTGHLPSPRWRPVAAVGVVALTLVALATAFGPEVLDYPPEVIRNPLAATGAVASILEPMAVIGWFGLQVTLVAGVIALVVRLRRARGDERQQIKWFVFAAALLLVSTVPIMVLGAWDWYGVGLAALAVAIGVAILRYRLYDIDVVINKTVVYASLAVFIGAVYVAVVVGLGTLLGSQGEPNAALSIFATAIVAIAFQPVRERVQRFANRLVYGQRATPYEVLARFSETVATLGADELLAHTAATLRDATGALGACVWLRSGEELTPVAAAPPETLAELGPAGLVDGGLPELPGDGAAAIIHQEELLGALTITKAKGDPLTLPDRQVLAALASQAGEVVRNASLTAALQARLEQLTVQAEELRRSRQRIVAAEDDERRSLERNIHDGAQQHLVALAVKLKLARTLAARAPDKAKVVVTQLRAQVDDTVAALRELASGIYPSVLEARGIVAALEAQTQGVGVPVTIESDGLGRYPIESEATAYFCCLEALQNVAKYAGASHARVSVAERDGELVFSVRDDGRGFDPDTTPFGSGLRNIADRVGAAQGTVIVESAPGAGTTVTGRIPATRLEAAA